MKTTKCGSCVNNKKYGCYFEDCKSASHYEKMMYRIVLVSKNGDHYANKIWGTRIVAIKEAQKWMYYDLCEAIYIEDNRDFTRSYIKGVKPAK